MFDFELLLGRLIAAEGTRILRSPRVLEAVRLVCVRTWNRELEHRQLALVVEWVVTLWARNAAKLRPAAGLELWSASDVDVYRLVEGITGSWVPPTPYAPGQLSELVRGRCAEGYRARPSECFVTTVVQRILLQLDHTLFETCGSCGATRTQPPMRGLSSYPLFPSYPGRFTSYDAQEAQRSDGNGMRGGRWRRAKFVTDVSPWQANAIRALEGD
jgi:hypothetical protein